MIKEELKDKTLCKIRTITLFITLSKNKEEWIKKIKKASLFAADLAQKFKNEGYIIQSLRIVTNPFGEYLDTSSLESASKDMQYLSDLLNSKEMPKYRIRFAIGEAKTLQEIEMLPKLIKSFGDLCNVCVNVGLDNYGNIDNDLTQRCAKIVKEISQITKNAEGNFNFTINYNCKPLIPYFPASYHKSENEDCFAIGLETPDLLVKSLENIVSKNHNEHLEKSYLAMSNSLQYHVDDILNIINSSNITSYKFAGIDSSAAPSKNCSSMVDVFKLLGVEYFGAAGTLEASSLLTKVFKSIKNCDLIGFSGLMLAVIEDEGLAEATKNKEFTIKDLISYSAVCGIGLDTVPIEGDTSVEKIANICRDTGAMAFRLNKPLTVRLFPVPDLNEGDITKFESDDLCNAAVLRVP